MATYERDVLKLFTTEAAFLGASKQRQMGIDKTTKRLLLHNNTDDTLVDGWSGDSLQALLAGAQTFSGKKTLGAGAVLPDNQKLFLGTGEDYAIYFDGTDVKFENTGATDMYMDIASTHHLQVAGNDIMKVDASGGYILDNLGFFFGTNLDSYIESDGTDTTWLSANNSIIIRANNNPIKLKYGAEDVLSTSSTGVSLNDGSGVNQLYVDTNGVWISQGTLFVQTIKTGATQVAAGAAQYELWATASHATLPDNVVLIGV